jgi:hypothetical protein
MPVHPRRLFLIRAASWAAVFATTLALVEVGPLSGLGAGAANTTAITELPAGVHAGPVPAVIVSGPGASVWFLAEGGTSGSPRSPLGG